MIRGGRRSPRPPSNLWAVLLAVLVGCAAPPEVYQPTEPYYVARQTPTDPATQIERGRPIWAIDALNDYLLSLPVKLLLLNRHLLDHELPEENERILRAYLELNGLRSVKVRHNQYAPIGELRRLFSNRDVGLGYRATLGLVNWLRYTLVPDRLFAGVPLVGGGDHFNPFSNTINVYSSDVAVLLHEAGHAKDYVSREMPGTSFALIRLLPGVDLLQEAAASNDAIRFLHCVRDTEGELRAYRTLIPAYSTYIAGYLTGGLAVTLPIVGTGHLAGRFRAWRRARSLAAAAASDSPLPLTSTAFLPTWCAPLAPDVPNLSRQTTAETGTE